ncbi:hypothetical protein JMA_25710 [Jeotgalibacillus malaysiensis]|uniref:Uncharacterized protein n=1 Tax=Jeotgalibacillus malaysiensis TaxID=1508404 RepID=A0A0B5ATJ4_9BACL|nr:sigma-70 family RNA polymerase sigma factor [Jeotgalibacillus malaysiensis]AJD91888.1 hypothetical protein JMA_25710 [Jeotgalibacillus malaysiensis]
MDQLKKQWLIEADQLLLQLGITSEHRQACLAALNQDKYDSRTAILKEAVFFARSSDHNEIEKVSPHADDQELHEAIQTLPFTQKSSLSLYHYHAFSESEIEYITSLTYQEILTQEETAIRSLAERWQTDKGRISRFLMLLNEAYKKQEPDLEQLPEAEEIAEEAVQGQQKKSKLPIIAAGGILAAAAGVIFLLNDPLPEVVEEASGSAEEQGEELVYEESKLAELDELIQTRKIELSEALGLSEDEVNRLVMVQNVESQLQFLRDVNEGYYDNSHSDHERMLTMLTQEIETTILPPMQMIEAGYNLAEEYEMTHKIMRSDMAVNMFMDTGQDLIQVYEQKLNENIDSIAPWNRSYYKDDELPEKERVLREKIKANGFTYDYDAENAEFTVMMGGDVFEEGMAFMHPVHQEFLKNMPLAYESLFPHNSNQTDPDYGLYAKEALNLEEQMKKLYELNEEVRSDKEKGHLYQGLPDRLGFQYSELVNRLISGADISGNRMNVELNEDQLTAWENILEDHAFKDSYLREMTAFHYTIGEQYGFVMPDGWSEIDFSPFYQMQGAVHDAGIFSAVEMPLEGYMKDIYDNYVAEGDVEALKILHPKHLILFYFNALQQGDYEIAYSLMGGEDLPDYARFEEIVGEHSFEFEPVNKLSYTGGSQTNEVSEANFGIQIHGNQIDISMVVEDGMYKVKYTSDGMFNMIDMKSEEEVSN